MDKNIQNTAFPIDELEEIFCKKSKLAESNEVSHSDVDGGVIRDTEENPTDEIPSTEEGANNADQNFDQNLTQFLSSKKDTPSREEKIDRAATLGLV